MSSLAAGVVALGLGALALSGCGGLPTKTPSSASSPSPRASGSAAPTDAPTAALPSDPAAYAAELLAETNDAREANDLPDLAGSACAQAAALLRAAALVGSAELTHAPLTGVITGCAPSTTAAENLSRATAAPPEVLSAWMGSPGHRSNLLDPALTELGVGCVPDGAEMLCSQVYLGP